MSKFTEDLYKKMSADAEGFSTDFSSNLYKEMSADAAETDRKANAGKLQVTQAPTFSGQLPVISRPANSDFQIKVQRNYADLVKQGQDPTDPVQPEKTIWGNIFDAGVKTITPWARPLLDSWAGDALKESAYQVSKPVLDDLKQKFIKTASQLIQGEINRRPNDVSPLFDPKNPEQSVFTLADKLNPLKLSQRLTDPEMQMDEMTSIVNTIQSLRGRPTYKNADDMLMHTPLGAAINSPTARKAILAVSNGTDDLGLKAVAALDRILPWKQENSQSSYEESYKYLQQLKNNPGNSYTAKIAYATQSALPQTAIGVLLKIGLSRIPVVGPALGTATSMAYYGALSAGEQVQETGQVTSPTKIAIDTIGDEILGDAVETLFTAKGSKRYLVEAIKNANVEGSTEVLQSLLKLQTDYHNAQTPEQRKAVVEKAKAYVSNEMSLEYLVGFLSGGVISSVSSVPASMLNNTTNIEVGGATNIDETPEETPEQKEARMAAEMKKLRTDPHARAITENLKALPQQGPDTIRVFHSQGVGEEVKPGAYVTTNTTYHALNSLATDHRTAYDIPVAEWNNYITNSTAARRGEDIFIISQPIPDAYKVYDSYKAGDSQAFAEAQRPQAEKLTSVPEELAKLHELVKPFRNLDQVEANKEVIAADLFGDKDAVKKLDALLKAHDVTLQQLYEARHIQPEVKPKEAPKVELPPQLEDETNRVAQKNREEFEAQGPGHQAFSKAFDDLAKTNTISPEHASLLRNLFYHTDDQFLNSITVRANGRITSLYGRAQFNVSGTIKNLEIRKGLMDLVNQKYENHGRHQDMQPSLTFLHEFAHLGYQFLLTDSEKSMVKEAYRKMGEQKLREYFQQGFGATSSNHRYYAGDYNEFFVQAFAEYSLTKKTPFHQLETLFEKLYRFLVDNLHRVVNRATPKEIANLEPLFEKVLSGDAKATFEEMRKRVATAQSRGEASIAASKLFRVTQLKGVKLTSTDPVTIIKQVAEHLYNTDNKEKSIFDLKYSDQAREVLRMPEDATNAELYGQWLAEIYNKDNRVIGLTDYEDLGELGINKELLKNWMELQHYNNTEEQVRAAVAEYNDINSKIQKMVNEEYQMYFDRRTKVIAHLDSYLFNNKQEVMNLGKIGQGFVSQLPGKGWTFGYNLELPGSPVERPMNVRTSNFFDNREEAIKTLAGRLEYNVSMLQYNHDKKSPAILKKIQAAVSELRSGEVAAALQGILTDEQFNERAAEALKSNKTSGKKKEVAFKITTPDNQVVDVKFTPFDSRPIPSSKFKGIHHLELNGKAISETGYRSYSFSPEQLSGRTPAEFVRAAVTHFSDEVKAAAAKKKRVRRAVKAKAAAVTIRHFTLPENVSKILEQGFDTTKLPLHGIGGLEGGPKTERFGGEGVLYFTQDDEHWNKATVYVGEGKGNISKKSYDYRNQKWVEEKNAYKSVDLSPVEATLKANAKVLEINDLQQAIDLLNSSRIGDRLGKFDMYTFLEDLLAIARQKGYDALHISDSGKWTSERLGTTKYGEDNWYRLLTGDSGKSDYFVFNKQAIKLNQPEKQTASYSFSTSKAAVKAHEQAYKQAVSTTAPVPEALNQPQDSPAYTTEVGKIKARIKIASDFAKAVGTVIRGKGFLHARALAIYKPWANTIRYKTGGLPTLFHEIAHHLDHGMTQLAYMLNPNMSRRQRRRIGFSNQLDLTEAKALMVEYGASYAGKPQKQRGEGFAEFIRFFMTGQQERAKQLAPKFYAWFNQELAKYPEIQQAMHTAAIEYQRYEEAPADAKVLVEMSINSEHQETWWKKNYGHYFTREWWSKFGKSANYHVLQSLHPIADLIDYGQRLGVAVSAAMNPFIRARLLAGWVGKAQTFLETGTFKSDDYLEVKDGKGKIKYTGKSLQAILKPIEAKGLLNDFRIFLVAQHSLELNMRGIKTNYSTSDAKYSRDLKLALHPEFAQAATDLYAYQNSLVEYAIDSGIISQKHAQAFQQLNKYYVPFYRVLEESLNATRAASKGRMANVSSPVKTMHGNDIWQIIDPIESVVKNTYAIINAAEKNKVGKLLYEFTRQAPELAQQFEDIDPKIKGTTITGKSFVDVSVKNVLKRAGMTESNIAKIFKNANLAEEVSTLVEATVTTFAPLYSPQPGVVTIMRGGKPTLVKVSDEMYRALLNLDAETVGPVIKFLSQPAAWLRSGATLVPEFYGKNVIRDSFSAFLYSEGGFMPIIDSIKGAIEIFNKGPAYQLWKMVGGQNASLVSMDRGTLQSTTGEIIDNSQLRSWHDIWQMVERGDISGAAKQVGARKFFRQGPMATLGDVSQFFEEATRVGEMKKVLAQTGDVYSATFASREVTQDFAVHGASMRAFGMLTAFFNPNIQGTAKMAREMKNNPTRFMMRGFLSLTLPTLLLHLLNRDDDEYWRQPAWKRNTFFMIPFKWNGERKFLLVPKPFGPGLLFSTMPQLALEAFDHKTPGMLTAARDAVLQEMVPNLVPTVASPLIENAANYSFFYNRPIDPASKEMFPDAEKYGPYSSETSKVLGQWLHMSPSKIDNLFRGYFAGMSKYGLAASDTLFANTVYGLEGKPLVNPLSKPDNGKPLVNAFIADPARGSRSEPVNMFYDLGQQIQEHESMVKRYQQMGKPKTAARYLNEHPEAQMATAYRALQRQMSTLAKYQDQALQDKRITKQQRDGVVKSIELQKLIIAEQFIKAYKQVKP